MQAKYYRPDIDTLRAIAVIAVVFYHAHIPYFGGGYVGVSIFFVISGYLITGIIKRSLENHTFSFLEFYENRIRRIVPALFFMLLVTLLFYAYFAVTMDEVFTLRRIVRRTVLAVSNFYFFRNTGYFDMAAENIPFLHTWSLAVEEQFYFIMPLFLFLLFRKKHSHINIYIYINTLTAQFCFLCLFCLRQPKIYFLHAPLKSMGASFRKFFGLHGLDTKASAV